jgi:transcriptional/translational regulatory protein YebC/TACO1
VEPADDEVTMRRAPTVTMEAEDARRTLRLIEMLEDLDDVQNVYSNAEISEDAYDTV